MISIIIAAPQGAEKTEMAKLITEAFGDTFGAFQIYSTNCELDLENFPTEDK